MTRVAAPTATVHDVADGIVGIRGTRARARIRPTALDDEAVVEQVGCVLSEDALSPFTKPESLDVMVGDNGSVRSSTRTRPSPREEQSRPPRSRDIT